MRPICFKFATDMPEALYYRKPLLTKKMFWVTNAWFSRTRSHMLAGAHAHTPIILRLESELRNFQWRAKVLMRRGDGGSFHAAPMLILLPESSFSQTRRTCAYVFTSHDATPLQCTLYTIQYMHAPQDTTYISCVYLFIIQFISALSTALLMRRKVNSRNAT